MRCVSKVSFGRRINADLLTFVCYWFLPFLVFDDEDENKLSYTEIHQQYKKLVSKLQSVIHMCQTCSLKNVRVFCKCPNFMQCLVKIVKHWRYIADSTNWSYVSCFVSVGGEAVRELHAGGWHQWAAVSGCVHFSFCQVPNSAGMLSSLLAQPSLAAS